MIFFWSAWNLEKNWDFEKTEENSENLDKTLIKRGLKVDSNWDKVENKTTYDIIQILSRFYPDFI